MEELSVSKLLQGSLVKNLAGIAVLCIGCTFKQEEYILVPQVHRMDDCLSLLVKSGAHG